MGTHYGYRCGRRRLHSLMDGRSHSGWIHCSLCRACRAQRTTWRQEARVLAARWNLLYTRRFRQGWRHNGAPLAARAGILPATFYCWVGLQLEMALSSSAHTTAAQPAAHHIPAWQPPPPHLHTTDVRAGVSADKIYPRSPHRHTGGTLRAKGRHGRATLRVGKGRNNLRSNLSHHQHSPFCPPLTVKKKQRL